MTSNFSNTTPLFNGQGYLELTQTDVNNNISRLVDTQRQIEISFYNIPDRLSFVQAAFPVVGMPKKFLILPTNASENLFRIYKHTFLLCRNPEKKTLEFCRNLKEHPWPGHHNQRKRHISTEVRFIHNKDEEVTEDNRLYSISYAWGTITLKDEVDLTTNYLPSTTKSLDKLYMFYSPNPKYNWITLNRGSEFTKTTFEKTNFEYLVDRTIRIQNTTSCMVKMGSRITFKSCNDGTDRWILDVLTNQIIEEKNIQCIAAGRVPSNIEFTIDIKTCNKNDKSQKWIFQNVNNNPDIIENNPEISSEELQEWRIEESNTLTSTINSPIFGGLLIVNQGEGNIVWDLISWGLLRSKAHNDTKCVTYHGVGKVLTLEDCDPNWTQCQENLQQRLANITNDPLVHSQTTVGNCSEKGKVRQALEYAADFTIRPFNTNF